MKRLEFTLRATGVVQVFFGALFVVAPTFTPSALGIDSTMPSWVTWLFVMMGARFLGYGYGMFVAARDPRGNVSWIDSMIVIQCIDWAGTLWAITAGGLALRNVTTAVLLPPLIVAALLWWHPRRLAADRNVPA